MSWVVLRVVGDKDGHKILNIGAGTREMVSTEPDKTLEPFVSTFLCLALAWEASFDVLWWGRAWQHLPLKSRRAAGVVDFINTWSRSRLVCGRPGGRPLRWWSFMSLACMVYIFGRSGHVQGHIVDSYVRYRLVLWLWIWRLWISGQAHG